MCNISRIIRWDNRKRMKREKYQWLSVRDVEVNVLILRVRVIVEKTFNYVFNPLFNTLV